MDILKITYIPAYIGVFTIISAMLNVFLFKYLGIKSKRARREDDISSFDTIVRNLSSADC